MKNSIIYFSLNANPYTVTFQGAGAYPRSSGHNGCRNTLGQVPHLRTHPWRSRVEVPEPLQEPQPHHSPGHSGLLAPSYAHILYRAAPRLALSAHAVWLWHGGHVRFVHPFQLWRKRAHAPKMLWTKMDVRVWEETSLQDKSPPSIRTTKLIPKIMEPVPKCPNQCKWSCFKSEHVWGLKEFVKGKNVNICMSLLAINQFLTTNWLLPTLASCDTHIQYLYDDLHFLKNTPSFASIASALMKIHLWQLHIRYVLALVDVFHSSRIPIVLRHFFVEFDQSRQ